MKNEETFIVEIKIERADGSIVGGEVQVDRLGIVKSIPNEALYVAALIDARTGARHFEEFEDTFGPSIRIKKAKGAI